jgi:uncharacterized protein (DUF2384 family)
MRLPPDPAAIPSTDFRQQLEHPTADGVWKRVVEVFGNEEKARKWMNSRRPIFGGRSPQELVDTADPSQLHQVLDMLIRIDYGLFS